MKSGLAMALCLRFDSCKFSTADVHPSEIRSPGLCANNYPILLSCTDCSVDFMTNSWRISRGVGVSCFEPNNPSIWAEMVPVFWSVRLTVEEADSSWHFTFAKDSCMVTKASHITAVDFSTSLTTPILTLLF